MRLTSASNRAVYERARKAVAQLRSNQFALIRPLCQLLIRPCQHLSRRPPRLRCHYRFLGAKGDCGVRAGCARAGCAFGRSCPAAAHGSICPAARLGRGREIKRSLLDLSSQPPDCRLTCIPCSKTSHAKSVFPPPGFSPRNITSPGGILGRGVSSQSCRNDVSSSHRAAFSRAMGNRMAILRLASSKA